MKPAVVIFDMDDVLCRYDLGRRLRALSRLSGRMPRDIRAAIWDSGFEDEADTGGYPDPDDYLREFGLRLGYPISRDAWVAARREAMTPWPDLLARARQIGAEARLAIYSNNGPLTKASLAELFPGLTEIFAEHYHSFEFGAKKPDPSSFRSLLQRMGVDAAHCWFIDDKRSNVTGARLAGLSGHHFTGHDGVRAEARKLGFPV
ncbi:MAG: HAD family hydrolase [Aestuariivirga sp.]|uniref:HAD family hydrolase n=1 Tax=Aestuariivirga sp. TaxID=2650926 RepID=UPI0038D0E086